ncbi:uncharacterized protein LOC132191853 [Corylus avellana]|uniref:uncharacterized protein LOC132191853 n=1 Tax=Corylus avellana TaxID=13451 RepID=UPI001E22F1EC|nr:uncharacterized protein LOC132191853 [Corylus avellana]
MGISPNAKAKTNNNMGLLLVFFPEDDNHPIVDKNKLFSPSSSSSPSPSSSSPPPPSISYSPSSSSLKSSNRRSSTTSKAIISRAQSTISICALFLFITLLLFTLSTFEPTANRIHPTSPPRRFLSQKPPPNYIHKPKANTKRNSSWFFKTFTEKSYKTTNSAVSPTALQGMGTLYRRGTKAMNDLVVAHVVEDVTGDELRLFSRALHRSGLTARADIVFVFASSSFSSRFGSVIQEENDSFFKLVRHYKESNSTNPKRVTGFDLTHFVKGGKKEKKEIEEPIWGKRFRSNYSNSDGFEKEAESTQLSVGSVVGFEASELDPENSLSGFLDHVPMNMRRWACYPMLLGRVRRNFKYVMLVDVKNSVVLGDPLGRVRNRSPVSVYLSPKPESSSGKHGRKNSDKTQSHSPVNSAVIMGGARGVRRLSSTMLTEIVRATMQHKKKSSVSESAILSQLVASEFMLKNIDVIRSAESIPDTSSLAGLNSGSSTSLSGYAVIQRNNGIYDFSSVLMKVLCSSEADSSVYRDC